MLVEIPDKTYFKIGEVARILGVKPHIVRYWESEFSQLKPSKTRSGQRLFRKKDIELLLTIRVLVHDHRYTVAGARERLEELAETGVTPADFLQSVGRSDADSIVETSKEQLSLDGFEHDLREAMQRRIDELEEELAKAHSEQTGGNALRRAAEELRDERDRLQEELAATQRELERATQVSLLDEETSSSADHALVEELRDEIATLRRQVQHEAATVIALRGRLEGVGELHQERDELRRKCEQFETSVAELRHALANSNSSLSTQRLLTEETHQSLRALQDESARQERLRRKVRSSCERIEAALRGTSGKH